jgi:riboflavin transporter FmnP
MKNFKVTLKVAIISALALLAMILPVLATTGSKG